MRRLKKLEGIVEELSGQIEIEKQSVGGSGTESPEAHAAASFSPDTQGRSNLGHIIYGGIGDSIADRPRGTRRSVASPPNIERPAIRQGSDVVQQDFGRLLLNEKGKARYVSSAFWSKMNDELDKLREETYQLSDQDSNISDVEETPPSMIGDPGVDDRDHHAFILGYSSATAPIRKYHPLVSQIPFLWEVFQENVDPLVKILHIPTMNKIIKDMRADMDNMSTATEALMFSIYYAAITSMDSDEVQATFHEEKLILIRRYRFAVEQALAKAQFLTSPDLVVLQALVLFIVLVRRHDDTRFSWTMTGLAIRIAHSLGLHRDGVHFPNLTPYEAEMRRRLWWAICVLDLRAAEDQGTDLTILDRLFDTEIPLNINDADITPESKTYPKARDTHTDITFALIRYEICKLARRMHTATSLIAPTSPQDAALTLDMREKMLLETHERVNKKYLKFGSTTDNPMYWVAATVARLILAKLSLIIHQPVLFPSQGTEVSEEIRDKLFVSSMEIVEYNLILHTEPRTKQWRWLFQTYTQWHAVAYLMFDICRRPWTPIVERAWACLEATFSRGQDLARISGNTAVLLPLRRLYLKARRHRESEIARLRANPTEAERLRATERVHVPPARFGMLPTCVNTSVALLRWRELLSPELNTNSQCNAVTPQAAIESNCPGPSEPEVNAAAPKQNSSQSLNNMGLIDYILTADLFDPTSLYPIAYPTNSDPSFVHLRSELMEQRCPNNAPTGQPPVANIPAAAAASHATASTSLFSQSCGPNSQPDTSLNNPPPWLWTDSWNSSMAEIPETEGDADGDINMEEDFDWDGFRDSLRGCDLETGVSTALRVVSGGRFDTFPLTYGTENWTSKNRDSTDRST